MLPFIFAGFEIHQVTSSEKLLTITARAFTPTAACPSCHQFSSHVHSYYTRSPQDLPISSRSVQLVLRVRRFRCCNPQCSRQTFGERLSQVPFWARQTSRLGAILESIAIVLSGQAGSRLTEQLGMPVSADTLLRRAKKKTAPPPTPRVLGVDDFAFRRGHQYGSVLIDLETRQPVDLLEDRSAETFAHWLRCHPGVEIISRDRSKDYQRGATDGAPQAQQVIDRWHVLQNLRETIERFLSKYQVSEATGPAIPSRQKRTSREQARSEGSRARRLALYQQVQELSRQGGTILGIARQLHLGHRRVRKFVRASSFPVWGKPARTRSAIDPYRPYLQERWQQGCHATSQLWQELQARGFSGSRMMVYRWIQLQRDGKTHALAHLQTPPVPKLAPRPLSWLFLRYPEQLKQQEKQVLALIRQAQQVEVAYGLSQRFVALLKERNVKLLQAWLQDCQKSGISDLVTFAQGLEKEGSALHAAFSLPYSNGVVEGKINKLKYIKRSMYGRCGFSLLRQKVLKAA
jgi:transposase